MKELTEEMKKAFENIAQKERERLEPFWSEPEEYKRLKRKNASFLHKPDVYISQRHDFVDFLAIGFACIAKLIEEKDAKNIYVGYKLYPSVEELKHMDIVDPPKFGNRMQANALYEMDVIRMIQKILEKYYSNPEMGAASMIMGVGVYAYVTTVIMGYTDEKPVIKFEFENFDDTVEAQKVAYRLLKEFVIGNSIGSLQAFIFGED